MVDACLNLVLSQSGQIEQGQAWQSIGAIGVAIGGLVMGLSLILHKEKEPKPNALPDWVAKSIGVAIILGGLLAACYVFWFI